MELPQNIYLHCLNLLPQFGPKRLLKLANYFEDFASAYKAGMLDMLAAGIEQEVAEKFINLRNKTNPETEMEKLAHGGISVMNFLDEAFSQLLLEIPSFPPILYYRGVMKTADELALAVVGTRKITNYGRSVIPYLLEPLIEAGMTIVSGLAYGVDSSAHRFTLEKGGRTIALLGCGIDNRTIYPKDHALLADEIISAGGAVVSEYPPGTPALKQHFVARNRIISGMSVGTLLIECDLKSGTLITAQHALDQNRQVYAVPGPIYAETSKGPNNIIKMGGKLVTEASDILNDLNINIHTVAATESIAGTKEELTLLELLQSEPVHADELIKVSGLDASQVTTTLTFLEMKGKIRNVGGQQYTRTR